MDPEDYTADLEEELRSVRSQLAEAKEEIRQLKEDLRIARERKVEETDEGVPPEEITHRTQNRANIRKKEETPGSGLGIAAAEPKVKIKIKVRPKKPEPTHDLDAALVVPTNGGSTVQPRLESSPQDDGDDVQEVKPKKSEPAHNTALAPTRKSTARPQREPGLITHPQDADDDDDDDVLMVDLARRAPGKRKGEGEQLSPRPAKRKTFWVEVPLRQKVLPVSVKREPSSPRVVAEAGGTTLTPKQEPDQEASDALSVIRNAGIKPDKKSLDDVSVFTRLSRVGLDIFPIPIEDKIKDLSVSRMWYLAGHFGGGPVETFPTIAKDKLEGHGFDHFMYLPLTLHPHAPTIPGAPGLWFCSCNCGHVADDLRLLVRVKTGPARWHYMGQYDLCPSDPFSTQEWAIQSNRTKNEWANCIRTESWGSETRARIKLRQLKGREPTVQEVQQLPDVDRSVTETDVLDAFDKGEERLYTWTLKCRGYDERFQKEIWDTAPAKHRSHGGSGGSRGSGAAKN